jgi:hypothetical protein
MLDWVPPFMQVNKVHLSLQRVTRKLATLLFVLVC